MLTGDLNVAEVAWIVQYRIADPVKYLFSNRNPALALSDVAQIVMRSVVGDHTVTEVPQCSAPPTFRGSTGYRSRFNAPDPQRSLAAPG